jgi:hypothetical protein
MTIELHVSPSPRRAGRELRVDAGPLAMVLTPEQPGLSLAGLELRARIGRGLSISVRMDLRLSWPRALGSWPRRADP